jgi:hypothetical protein
VVPDDRAHKTDDVGRDAPALPKPLPLENEGPHPHAVEPRARPQRKPLMFVPALVLVLIAVGWVVAISVFIYWAVT